MDKNILFGYLGKSYRGGDVYQVENFKHFEKNLIQCGFLTMHKELFYQDEVLNNGGQIHYISNLRHFIKRYKQIKKLRKIYDVVYLHKANAVFPELLLYKIAGYRIVLHSHSTTIDKKLFFKTVYILLNYFSRPFIGLLSKNYFACSEDAGKWFFGKRRFKKGQVSVLNNGIECETFKFDERVRNKIRSEYCIKNEIIIGQVGALSIVKNHKFTLDILRCLTEKNSDYKLWVVGDGPLADEVKEQAHIYGLSDKIVFFGGRKDVSVLMQAMDIFILPSLREGLPFTGIEAQTAGLLCVVSDTVSTELDLSGNVKFLSLEKGPSFWAEEILIIKTKDRSKGFQKVSEAGFDIKDTAKKLQNALLNLK